MKSPKLIAPVFVLFLIAAIIYPLQSSAFQKRDHLTPQEVDLVKENQILDKRIEVFIKAAERRVMVINGTAAANAKQLKKDAEKWGELPAGSRFELVGDIASLENLNEYAQQILAAATKLPPEVDKKAKKN